ncbi:MAG: FecR domain-containing protein, partial [Kiritimatiellaeota bacterium]|nr:FecR domain-containing protein [Kiritimatiellota bacterium]
MKSGPDKFALLMRYLDGKLSDDELRAVNELLRTDADARQWLREISHQAFVLGDIARERTVEGKPTTSTTVPRQNGWRPLAWAAAAVAVLSAGLFGWSQWGAQPVVTLTEASGSVIWSGDRGATRTELATGARLPAGTVETIGAVSSAQLRFSDGTLLTLGGNSELTFAVTGQKRIQLKSGSLTAAV